MSACPKIHCTSMSLAPAAHKSTAAVCLRRCGVRRGNIELMAGDHNFDQYAPSRAAVDSAPRGSCPLEPATDEPFFAPCTAQTIRRSALHQRPRLPESRPPVRDRLPVGGGSSAIWPEPRRPSLPSGRTRNRPDVPPRLTRRRRRPLTTRQLSDRARPSGHPRFFFALPSRPPVDGGPQRAI
jgi:hypothetical protein